MEKQAGPFGRMRNWRTQQTTQPTNYQQPAYNSQANFNPVQSQASSINRVRSSIQNTGTAQPAIPRQNATIRPYQNTTGTMQNTPQNTTTQPRPQVKSTQPSAFYRQNMTAINQLNDFSKFTPDLIQGRLQEAVSRGEVSERESQMLLNTFKTRYNQWQKRPRGTVETRPTAPTQPVVRNQSAALTTNTPAQPAKTSNPTPQTQTRYVAPDGRLRTNPGNGRLPVYDSNGQFVLNENTPISVPQQDETGGGSAYGMHLDPEELQILQNFMLDNQAARDYNREWDKYTANRIRTGGKSPKPMEFMPDKDRRKEEAYHQRIRKLNAEYQEEIAQNQRAAQQVMLARENDTAPQNTASPQTQKLQAARRVSSALMRFGGPGVGANATPEQLQARVEDARGRLAAIPKRRRGNDALALQKALDEYDSLQDMDVMTSDSTQEPQAQNGMYTGSNKNIYSAIGHINNSAAQQAYRQITDDRSMYRSATKLLNENPRLAMTPQGKKIINWLRTYQGEI